MMVAADANIKMFLILRAWVHDKYPVPLPVFCNKCSTYPCSFPMIIKSHNHCSRKKTATYVKGAFTVFAKHHYFNFKNSRREIQIVVIETRSQDLSDLVRGSMIVAWPWELPILFRSSIAARWESFSDFSLLNSKYKISSLKHQSVFESLESKSSW